MPDSKLAGARRAQPLEAVVEADARRSARLLDVPFPLAQLREPELFGDLGSDHRVRQVLFVCVDKEDHDLVPAVTNATFRDEVIAPHNDVLVKVYASWSRASSELAKPYAQVAYYFDSKGESREQKLLVTKIDGSRYKVPELDAHALPSLFLFPRYDKRHALRYEGDLSYDSIVKWVEAHRPGGHVHDEL